ncbi:MAG: hypothetical protein HYY17_15050 [Planctomycetes bacterium]|nr:hypothetical protein [Planctomycetota bacterium]
MSNYARCLIAVAVLCVAPPAGAAQEGSDDVFVRTKNSAAADTARLRVTRSTAAPDIGGVYVDNARLRLGSAGYLNIASSAAATPVAGDVMYNAGTLQYYDGAWKTVAVASPSGAYAWFAPSSAQTDSSANASIFINDTAGGNLLQLQSGGTNRLVVGNAGDASVTYTANPAIASTNTGLAVAMIDVTSTLANTNRGISGTATDTTVVTTAITKTTQGGYFSASKTGASTAGAFNTYGVYASATGDANGVSTAYGIYATASGADTNWAGYFSGAVRVTGRLQYGSSEYLEDGGANTTTFGLTSIVPSADASYSLGGTASRWANLYLSGDVLTSTGSIRYVQNQTAALQAASFRVSGSAEVDGTATPQFRAATSSSTAGATAFLGYASSSTAGTGYGLNQSIAAVKGDLWWGVAYHFAVAGYRYDDSGGPSAGVFGAASRTDNPTTWGALGYQDGASAQYGVYASSTANSDTAYGYRGYASSSSAKPAYGLWSSGTNSSTGLAYGTYSTAGASTGGAYGTLSTASGPWAYGTYSSASTSTSTAFGAYGYAYSASAGAYGLYGYGYSGSATSSAYGLRTYAFNSSAGTSYGLYSSATTSNTYEVAAGTGGGTWGDAATCSGDSYNTGFDDAKSQSIYLASDLTAIGMSAGTITSIQLRCRQTPGTTLSNIRIRMKLTTDATLSALDNTGLTLVYGPFSVSPSAGFWWSFGTSFYWDGTSNLLIEITRDGASSAANGGMYVRTGLAAGRTWAGYENAGTYSDTWAIANQAGYAFVPEMRFTMSGVGTAYAGYFSGDVTVTGTLSKGGGTFLIDHPLDPTNRILRHSFVESPEMMNIYKGRARLGGGRAVIELPPYFDALNAPDGREISLTCVGGFSPLYVDGPVVKNRFTVRTAEGGRPDQEFSWIVYAVRHDPYARAHPIKVEEEKGRANGFTRGTYLHPDAYGVAADKADPSVRPREEDPKEGPHPPNEKPGGKR